MENLNRIIEALVSPTGEIKLETQGWAGTTCQDASRFLEEGLGARQNEQLTAEFHQHTRLQENHGEIWR